MVNIAKIANNPKVIKSENIEYAANVEATTTKPAKPMNAESINANIHKMNIPDKMDSIKFSILYIYFTLMVSLNNELQIIPSMINANVPNPVQYNNSAAVCNPTTTNGMDNIILKRPIRNPMQTIKPKLIFMKLSIYVIDTANIALPDKTEHKNAG